MRRQTGNCTGNTTYPKSFLPCLQSARSWVPPPITLLSLILLLVSLTSYLAPPLGVHWLVHLKWVSLVAVAVGSPPIVCKAWGALRGKVRCGCGP